MQKTLLVLIVLSLLTFGCSKKDSPRSGNNTIATLVTQAVSNITASSATSGGIISSNGGSQVTTSGICWSTNPNPTISLSTKTTDGNNTNFSSNLTGLSANTTYYVRAYATNSAGTAYGNEISFTTSSLTIPVITTTAVTNVWSNGATSGGTITSNGGSPITTSGICWSTTPNPTISLSTKTSDGNTTNFSSNLTGLIPGNTYYVRAYATNIIGTAYGNEISFLVTNSFSNLDNALLAKMNQYNIPSISVAVIRNERLVYVKAYGKSDIEANINATTNDLYRIASVSKPLTVIAILKLVQDGLINLDQRVFGSGSILGNDFGTFPVGSNKDLITVRHLIEHKSGWANIPDDPMFRSNNITQAALITDLVVNRALVSTPGSTINYSNFGYCVLGRIIEKISGTSYENYVRNNILTPIGITTMKIGGSTLAERSLNEVKYYQSEFSPYLLNIPRLDAAGGWIASSTDLAKFIVRVDRNNMKQDIIPTNLLNQFYFGFTNWFHYGSLSGTSAILNRMDNNISFVLLANTRTHNDHNLILNDLNTTLQTQLNTITSWPTVDLF